MIANSKCCRDILLEIEKIPYNEYMTVGDMQKKLNYPLEDFLEAITCLQRDRCVLFADKQQYDDGEIFKDNKLKSLSYKGIKYLDVIRDEDVWNEIFTKLPNAEKLSFFAIISIATRIDIARTNRLFDIPENLVDDVYRW